MKKVIILLITTAVAAFLFFQIISVQFLPAVVEINFFDVGQGDSSLIQLPNSYQILVDGGPDEKVMDELHKAMPFADRKIETIILTHPDSDHLAGLLNVVTDYEVDQVFVSAGNEESLMYDIFKTALQKSQIKIIPISRHQQIEIYKDITITFFSPIQ